MADLLGLWLPILVSSIVVFFASFVSWMLLPLHKKDWQPLPDERGVFDALADRLGVGIGRGEYKHPTPAGHRFAYAYTHVVKPRRVQLHALSVFCVAERCGNVARSQHEGHRAA